MMEIEIGSAKLTSLPFMVIKSPILYILSVLSRNIFTVEVLSKTINLCSLKFSPLRTFIVHSPTVASDGTLKLSIVKVPVLSEYVSIILIIFPWGFEIVTFSNTLSPVLPITSTWSPILYSFSMVWNSIAPEPVDRPTVKVTRPLVVPCLTSAVKTPLPNTLSSTTNVPYPLSSNCTDSLIFSFVKESREPFRIICCKEFQVRSSVSGSFAIVRQKLGITFILRSFFILLKIFFTFVLAFFSLIGLNKVIILPYFGLIITQIIILRFLNYWIIFSFDVFYFFCTLNLFFVDHDVFLGIR